MKAKTNILQRALARCREQEADELSFYAALKRGVKIAHKSNTISAVVITPVGYSCNLACYYCFNKGDNSPRVMSEELLESAIREVVDVSDNPEFIWHGGEPMLAGMEFYENALALQQKHGLSEYKTRNAMQTNGTLLDDNWAAFLKEHDFKLGISLDGSEKIHNAHRKHPNGEGSFQDVMRAIENLGKHKKSFGVVAIINNKNLSPDALLDFFIQHNLFQLSVNPGLNGASLLAQSYADFMCGLFDAWLESDQPELQISFFEGLMQAYLGLSHNICWLNGKCHQIIRIDQTGDVWPCCDRYLPFTQYKLGNIRQGGLKEILSGSIYNNFRDTFGKPPARCMNCEWSHICKGGCAYHRLINGQGQDGGDPLCGAYKQIFEHVFSAYQEIYTQAENA